MVTVNKLAILQSQKNVTDEHEISLMNHLTLEIVSTAGAQFQFKLPAVMHAAKILPQTWLEQFLTDSAEFVKTTLRSTVLRWRSYVPRDIVRT